MVGTYALGGTYHGFQLSGTTYTTIDYPGAVFTAAYGINNNGQIVGFYYGSDTIDHAFRDFSGVFSTVDYPGSSASALTGINDAGQVVGQWFGSGTKAGYDEHGYLASPIPGTPDLLGNKLRRAETSPHR